MPLCPIPPKVVIYSLSFSRSFCIFSTVGTKVAPLNINKVSSSLLSFGRKLIAPMGGGSSGVSPFNSEVVSSSFQQPQALAEQTSNTVSSRAQMHVAQQRLLKSESMPVHLSKGENILLQVITLIFAPPPFLVWKKQHSLN